MVGARADAGNAADQIVLRGLRAVGNHGVFDHEQRDGQEFRVDVALTVDTTRAGTSDDLSATVDYGALAEALVGVIRGEPVNLIETLAHRLAATCLADPLVAEVEVTVHKPNAPVPHEFDDVSVTVRRGRS